ncbi:hypothetical protein V6N13_018173 [Hibiscus sabdariffa]
MQPLRARSLGVGFLFLMWVDFCGVEWGGSTAASFEVWCRVGTGVGWVAQQQYPLRLDQASSTEPTRSCINMTKASSGWPSRGHELPPPTGHGDLPSDGISHSKGTLPDIGNLVMESLAAPPKRFLALRPTMPGEFDIVRDP